MKAITTGQDNSQGLQTDQFATIHVTKRTDRSLLMFLVQHLIKPMRRHLISPQTEQPSGSPQLEPHKKVRTKIDASERNVDDIYIYDILPKKKGETNVFASKEKPRKRIYYFAGGGWQMPASGEHWSMIAELAIKLPNTAISLVSYPLAPKSPAPVAFPMLMKLYRTIMREASEAGETVILAGDSSGGNIVLCLLINSLLEDVETSIEQPCPKAVMVVSPSTDLRRQNIDIPSIAKKDPILKPAFINSTAQAWRGDWPPCDVRVSPLYADLTPIKKRGIKIHGVSGGFDILSPDAILFREKCNQAFISGEWLDWEKQMHCFPIAFSFRLRESVEAKNWILEVLTRS